MQDNNDVKLFFNNEVFEIHLNNHSLNDVSQDILQELLTKQQYNVKSIVNREVFQSFIDNWINGSIPNLDENNISQFDQLSKEFDRMKDIIRIYNKYSPNKDKSILISKNINLKNQLSLKIKLFQSKTIKYQQIIQFLFKNGGINSKSIFLRIKDKLFEACNKENSDLVDFLTLKRIKVNEISFILNENDKTAAVYKNRNLSGDIFIPREIEYESQKYVITSIFKGAFKNSDKIQSIQFSKDSKLILIDDESFNNSKITKIKIPQKVTKIGKYAFNNSSINEIEFSENSNLKIIDESAFSYSLICSITIPDSVQKIEAYAFYGCQQLNCIEFSNNSKLTILGQYALSETTLNSIFLPPKLTQIESCLFFNCCYLNSIEFSKDSELTSISKESFTNTFLESLSLPSSVIKFEGGLCSLCSRLNDIKIIECKEKNISLFDKKLLLAKSDRKSDIFDTLVFARRNIKYVKIPSFVTKIITNAFNDCLSLEKVEFEKNSKLNTIEKHAFSDSTLEQISIPSNVTTICEYAFYHCLYLQKVIFSENSKLNSILMDAFGSSKIDSIVIPSSVSKIGEFAFSFCQNLQIVEIQEKSAIDLLKTNVFSYSKKVIIMIPMILKDIINKE